MSVSTCFQKAWALLKMPYHGTDLVSAEKILSGGTKAQKDPRPSFRRNPAAFFMGDETEARYHARKRATQSGSPPVILHITDEGVASVPHRRMNTTSNLPEIITHGYPHRIDPKHISIHEQGPEPSMDLEEIRWPMTEKGRQQAILELSEMEDLDASDDIWFEWEQAKQKRKNQLNEYRQQLREAGW
jgi:hypothetical protein